MLFFLCSLKLILFPQIFSQSKNFFFLIFLFGSLRAGTSEIPTWFELNLLQGFYQNILD